MTKLIKEVKQFKAELKEKYLDYYEANQIWLKQMDGHGQSITEPWFILGVVTALESRSEFKELLQYFLMVSKYSDSIIQALELDFDPEIELKKRSLEQKEETEKNGLQELDKIREEIKT